MRKQVAFAAILCAALLIIISFGYAFIYGPHLPALLLAVAAIALTALANKTHLRPSNSDNRIGERNRPMRRFHPWQLRAALFFVAGLVWIVISIQFISGSTQTGFFLTLGVGMVLFCLGAACLICDTIQRGFRGRD